MRFRLWAALLAIVAAAAAAACSGRSGLLAPDYEYEEDLTLSLDGSATLVVNASVPALAALHGIPLDGDPRSRVDLLKEQVRAAYASPYADVLRVSVWTRAGRRFVGVRLRVPDVRALPKASPFAWAKYELREEGELVIFRETISGGAASAPNAGWNGDEIIAFRLHLPARIRFHNSRDLRTGGTRGVARGNILTWEQRLVDRMAGKPVAWSEDHQPGVMEAHMDRQSILYRTLWLFGLAFAAALLVMAGLIWLTMRRGSSDPESSSPRR
jgi:hypothetical protein